MFHKNHLNIGPHNNQPRPPTSRAYQSTFFTSLFIQGCTVLQGVLLARLLGPAGRGEFAISIFWPTVFAGIGIFGVNMALARFAGQGWAADGLVKTALKASLVTSALSALLCWLLLPILLPADKHQLLPVAYWFVMFIPLNHLALNLQGIDHGAGNFRWLNITRAVLYPVFFTGIALCWWLATDKVFWVAVALLIANGSVVVLRLVVRLKSLWSTEAGVASTTLLRASSPFVVASIVTILYMQMDKALLVWLLAPAEIGWYVAAFAAAGSVNVLNGALGIVQFSTAAQAVPGHGFANLAMVLRRGAIMSLAGGVFLGALFPWLVPLVYGGDFRPATVVAYILLPGMVLAGLGEIVNQALRGQGQPLAVVVPRVFGLVVMGCIGAVLAENWGGQGIACGYLAGELVAFSGLLLVAAKYYRDADWLLLWPSMEDVRFLLGRIFKDK